MRILNLIDDAFFSLVFKLGMKREFVDDYTLVYHGDEYELKFVLQRHGVDFLALLKKKRTNEVLPAYTLFQKLGSPVLNYEKCDSDDLNNVNWHFALISLVFSNINDFFEPQDCKIGLNKKSESPILNKSAGSSLRGIRHLIHPNNEPALRVHYSYASNNISGLENVYQFIEKILNLAGGYVFYFAEVNGNKVNVFNQIDKVQRNEHIAYLHVVCGVVFKFFSEEKKIQSDFIEESLQIYIFNEEGHNNDPFMTIEVYPRLFDDFVLVGGEYHDWSKVASLNKKSINCFLKEIEDLGLGRRVSDVN